MGKGSKAIANIGPSAVGDSTMLVIFFGSVALQFERTSSQPHLGSDHGSETKAKRAFNPQVNKIPSHSFKGYPNSLGVDLFPTPSTSSRLGSSDQPL
jgi:hypothetical protein